MQFVKRNAALPLNLNSYPGYFDSFGNRGNQPEMVMNRWQKPGDNATIARFTTASSTPTSSVFTISDSWYNYNASYIRVKNVSLSWQLPAKWLKKASLQNAKIYIHAQNLGTITNYTGLDPETRSISTLPPLRMITVGGQIDF